MITDFMTLLNTALDGQTYSGVYMSHAPISAAYPKVVADLIDDNVTQGKDATMYGFARFQVDVFAKDTSTKSGVQIVNELADELITINGNLPSSGNIVEVRVVDRDIRYDEETEATSFRIDYMVQHK